VLSEFCNSLLHDLSNACWTIAVGKLVASTEDSVNRPGKILRKATAYFAQAELDRRPR
jgi:hypothetical protein